MCSSFLREEGRLIFQKVLIYGSSFRIVVERDIFIYSVLGFVFSRFLKNILRKISFLYLS